MSLVNEKKSLESALQTLKAKIDSLDSEDSNKKFEEKLNALKAQFENEKTELKKNVQNEFDVRLKQELAKVNSDLLENRTKHDKEDQTNKELEAAIKEKNEALEKTFQEKKSQLEDELKVKFEQKLKEKVDEEVSKRSSGETNGDMNLVRDELIKQHEGEIAKLRKDFDTQLSKAKDDVKNVTEKKFEIKLRMLNKKLDKLEGKNLTDQSVLSSTKTPVDETNKLSVSSLPATPNLAQDSLQPITSQELSKLPLGHQFTESTLTVHRPTIDRTNLSNKALQAQKPNVEKLGQKRPMVNKSQNTNKRTKE